MKIQTDKKETKQAGFTLVELMLATAIVAIVLAATYANYRTQQRSQLVQSQVAEMQQNIRSAMLNMVRDIREAGSDPKFCNKSVYTTAAGTSWGNFDDGFRRRLAVTTIQCRNLGL